MKRLYNYIIHGPNADQYRLVGIVAITLTLIYGFIFFTMWSALRETDYHLEPGEYTTDTWYFVVLDDGSLEDIRDFR